MAMYDLSDIFHSFRIRYIHFKWILPITFLYFSSELELFLCLVKTIMPFFHWWYEDLIHDTTKSLMPPMVDVDSLQDVLCQ